MDYIAFAIGMGILAAVFAVCWALEIRASCKSRQWFTDELMQLGNERTKAITALQEKHAFELERVRHEAWKEGVKIGAEARRQMRYNQHSPAFFHHSKQGKF